MGSPLNKSQRRSGTVLLGMEGCLKAKACGLCMSTFSGLANMLVIFYCVSFYGTPTLHHKKEKEHALCVHLLVAILKKNTGIFQHISGIPRTRHFLSGASHRPSHPSLDLQQARNAPPRFSLDLPPTQTEPKTTPTCVFGQVSKLLAT